MKRKRIGAIFIFTFFIALFGLAGTSYERTAGLAFLGFYSFALLFLISYKIHLWIKYRNEPSRREAVLYSTQVLPPKLMRFILDEDSAASKRDDG